MDKKTFALTDAVSKCLSYLEGGRIVSCEESDEYYAFRILDMSITTVTDIIPMGVVVIINKSSGEITRKVGMRFTIEYKVNKNIDFNPIYIAEYLPDNMKDYYEQLWSKTYGQKT